MTFTPNPLSSLHFARDYTHSLLDDIPDSEWFVMPGGVTHVAWQVGHLASAELRLCLIRVRGPQPIDEELFPLAVRQYFMKDDTPRADPAVYPSPAELRAILNRLREQVLAEVPTYTEAMLAEPLEGPPHRLCQTKGDCLAWAPRHELIHAGQIGLLRRLLGKKPVW